METSVIEVKEKLKLSSKTKIELMQAIANLKRQNTSGQFTERIKWCEEALSAKMSVVQKVNVKRLVPSAGEVMAIMHFNNDTRFTITE